MDELKLNFSGKFMKTFVAKIIKSFVSKKFGFDVDVLINQVQIVADNEKVRMHIDVDAVTDIENIDNIRKVLL